MIIRGANGAITRQDGCTILNVRQLMHLMTRRERLTLLRMLEAYNEDEKLTLARPRRDIAVKSPTYTARDPNDDQQQNADL